MQNYTLLRLLGTIDKPVLLKRGLSATYEDLLMSAEYIMAGGNNKVILCERGIRTFEPSTRNTLDITAVPMLRQLTHLPILIDPSHASGKSALVSSLACAAVGAGADGLMIEVHNDPAHGFCQDHCMGNDRAPAEDDGKYLFPVKGCDAAGRQIVRHDNGIFRKRQFFFFL